MLQGNVDLCTHISGIDVVFGETPCHTSFLSDDTMHFSRHSGY